MHELAVYLVADGDAKPLQGSLMSPFASQLYQMPKDLQVQLEGGSARSAGVDQPMRSRHDLGQVWVQNPLSGKLCPVLGLCTHLANCC